MGIKNFILPLHTKKLQKLSERIIKSAAAAKETSKMCELLRAEYQKLENRRADTITGSDGPEMRNLPENPDQNRVKVSVIRY